MYEHHRAALTNSVERIWTYMKPILGNPLAKAIVGLIVGIGLLLIVSRSVNMADGIAMVWQNLITPRGIIFALLSGTAFLAAFIIRGTRWKLFLSAICSIPTRKVIHVYLVSIFINFLFSVGSGELAKTLMLKRIAAIPISRSLPIIAMDRSLDLLPALIIMALVPLLGLELDARLWMVLSAVTGLLVGITLFVLLTVWKRAVTIFLLYKITGMLPRTAGKNLEMFALNLIDSLITAASRPGIFLLALLLTSLAIICDGLFAMLAFRVIGFSIPFPMALFGYTVFNMFFILPTPPGQVGSNQAIGLLVFTGLLHLPATNVIAMFVFSHPWAAILMCIAGLSGLRVLGLTISSILKTMKTSAQNDPVNERDR